MSRKRLTDRKKVTMNFHSSSYQRMGELYPSVGPQAAIRALVHEHVLKADAKLVRETEELVKQIDLEEIDV